MTQRKPRTITGWRAWAMLIFLGLAALDVLGSYLIQQEHEKYCAQNPSETSCPGVLPGSPSSPDTVE